MLITKTRKAIIELIEPYMDKTLSEGCLVKTNIKNYKFTKVLFHGYQTTDYTGRQFEYILCINGNKTKIISKWKIIGHYDITAVIKYIVKNRGRYIEENNIMFVYLGFEGLRKIGEEPGDYIGDFPIKPLHLYTKEEDKQLLDLLLKLN